MCEIKDNLLSKIHDQIKEKKQKIEEATVHTFDDGSSTVNFFKTWDEYFGGSLKKDIKTFGDYPNDRKPIMVFAKKGIHIPLTEFAQAKTYVIMGGRIDFIFENNEIIEVDDLSTIYVPKGQKHGGMVRKDTFVLICEEDID